MLSIILILLLDVTSAHIPDGNVSLSIPPGWRQLETPETKQLKPQLEPQNKLQRRFQDDASGSVPLIAIKHDTAEGTMSASAHLFVSRLPPSLRGASSVEAARVMAFTGLAAFPGKYEVEPHELTVAGFPAAEWVIRYELVETAGGRHDMRTRSIVIVRGERLYLLGYSGPASDAADFAAFETVVKSLTFSK